MNDLKNDKKIKIPESFYHKIQEEKLRTGYGAKKILRGRKDIPKGLNSSVINGWLFQRVAMGKPSFMKYVEDLYANLPDGNLQENEKKFKNYARRKELKNYVVVDTELIKNHMNRSGLTATNISSTIKEQGAEISFESLVNMIHGAQKTTHKNDYELIIKCLLNAPDYEPPPLVPVKKLKQKLRDGYIHLTPAKMERLQFYRSKQLLPYNIFKDIPFAPQNPRPRDIINWFSGKNASIKKTDWEFIEHHCEAALEAVCPQA